MRIREIKAYRLRAPRPEQSRPPRREPWPERTEVANPMSRYPRYKARRQSWTPTWGGVWCKVTAEDGTYGLGMTSHGTPVASVIEEYLGPRLVGEDCLATERLWDMMARLTKPFGTQGLASYAISAVDLALWDLKGKLLGQPVYRLLGGPARDRIFCYATGNDTDWYVELGFQASKLACPYGPVDGPKGLEENERLVAWAREVLGPHRELMLDCWMSLDVEYAVRLAERLRPYRLRWIEEPLPPEDLESHAELRRRLPWQTLATGEHWYSVEPFFHASAHRLVDILQPDILWVGGLTACVKIAHIAESAGLSVILHGGANTPFGQHFSYALPNVPWAEFFVASPPGVPLEESARVVPGMPVPKDGFLVPSDAPGFGLEVREEWLEPYFP